MVIIFFYYQIVVLFYLKYFLPSIIVSPANDFLRLQGP
jgi:hypothetical protein